ncbi:hypothetical protein [Jeotgalibacillus sp. R-1-5s-1]|uniref:hypothetical protein n=1 Tax=Jeotgalibacillus sp. R-1-5s-1 TaxID=2555897 RepID=UPI001069A4D6|nr:hypothetical protein [Jeotgalibacillus sp. R-1-5s-1]TFD97058.1 hypothetical protein E2491_10215 [Jeotgalibacillus sp. R-1-5s-1]
MENVALEKESLIENIKFTHNNLIIIEKNEQTYEQMFKKPLKVNNFIHAVIIILTFLPFVISVEAILIFLLDLFTFNTSRGNSNSFIELFGFFIAVGLYFYGYRLMWRLINKLVTLPNVTNASKLNALQEEINQLEKIVDEQSLVPHKFRTSFCTIRLHGYLTDLEADTLKEALNLLKSEIMHIERMESDAETQRLQRIANNELDSINLKMRMKD